MKKKIITFILFFFLFTPLVNAESSSPSAVTKNSGNYMLAYPGMLPDNPLYKLKIIRDKIAILLISDPKAKIQFYLLKTDKGIAAADMLVKKNKVALAKETALKAENNYTLITYEVKKIKWDVTEKEFRKLEKAGLKHQDVLREIIKKVSKEDRSTFETVLYFSERNLQEIKNTVRP